jgi:hypothetical protein
MKLVTLGDLLRCEQKYAKVRPHKLTDFYAWERDFAALKAAIEHARRGVTVYVTNNVGTALDGQHNYYLLAGSDELEATLCGNHLARKV